MQGSIKAPLASLAIAAAGMLLSSTPAHADAFKTRCDADWVDPATARLRLEWARACAISVNIVSFTNPKPPSFVYPTGLVSTNGIPLWEYIETDDFWGWNSYSGDIAAVNQAFTQNQWRTGPYTATALPGGFQKWTESPSLALARPTYPTFGTSFDPASGSQLFPNPNYALLDCGFYTDAAATHRADTSATGFYMNGYCPSSDIPTSGIDLWLRADAGITAPAGSVSQWADQSGNGRNAVMATPARQPFYVANALHGMPVLRFNGAQSMDLSIYAQPTTFTVFVVGKNSTPSETFSMILGPGGNSPNNQLRWDSGSSAMFVGLGNNMPIITSPIGNTRIYHELSASYNGATMTVYRDGSPVSSSSFATTGPWTLASVGAYYSSYFMNGDLAEVVIYDRVLSPGQRVWIDSYLQTKYFLSCGNGICTANENSSTCPSDCPTCGDGVCGPNEDMWSCPNDCGYCGDGVCGGNENWWSCAYDCGYCGDGVCGFDETWTCSFDCNPECGGGGPVPISGDQTIIRCPLPALQ